MREPKQPPPTTTRTPNPPKPSPNSEATDAAERSRALVALTFGASPALAARALDLALSDRVRAQDVTALVSRVAARGGAGHAAAWQFLKE